VGIVQQALPEGAKVRCIGGAALFKSPDAAGHDATPFHQDGAYAVAAADNGSAQAARSQTRACALWLALSPADATSGCLRFAPSLGLELLAHDTAPRDEAPSGFETFLPVGSEAADKAEREAVSASVDPGDALVINPRVVHGSHNATKRERVAFSPLYEWSAE
jgi:ectoine hydroxylase-related dioxygenase (phytanoyl-CoA dioxygenase family)